MTIEQRAWVIADKFRDRLIRDGSTADFNALVGEITAALRAEREWLIGVVTRRAINCGMDEDHLRFHAEGVGMAIRERDMGPS